MFFQWYVFVLLIVVVFLTKLVNQTQVVSLFGQRQERYGWGSVSTIMLPLIFWAGTRGDMEFGDTSAYKAGFREIPSSLGELPGYFTEDSKDKGFTVVSVIIKSIVGSNDVIYFFIIAAVCVFCVIWTYKRYSYNFAISVFLFLASADYLQWTYNGIRQFIPVAIIFACTGSMLKKKYVPLIILILLLSTIHASALIMLPMIFVVQGKPFNKKTILFLVVILVAISFIDQFTDIITNIMENTQYRGEVDQYLSTEGTSIQRVLVYSIPAMLAFIFRKRIENANNPLINLCANMSAATLGCYVLSAFSSGLFIGRLGIFFSLYNYILLPWEIENIFKRKSAKLIWFLMIAMYMVFYYYQVSITWKL